MLADIDIQEFKRLYKNKYGIELSDDEAYEQGIKIIELVKSIYKPIKKNEYKKSN